MEETKEEEYWNTLTHFIGLILSIIGLPILLYYNKNLTDFSFESILLFEFGMICLYSASTLYHYSTNLTSWSWTGLYGARKENKIDYSKLSKGDLKKLQAQGKIKSIYFPYN